MEHMKMNEKGLIYIPKTSKFAGAFLNINDFFSFFDEEPIINFDKQNECFEVYIYNDKYILEIPDFMKKQIKRGVWNKHIRKLMEKAQNGEYVAMKVEKESKYPTDEDEIRYYLNYLENAYDFTQAEVKLNGVMCITGATCIAISGTGVANLASNEEMKINQRRYEALTVSSVLLLILLGNLMVKNIKKMSQEKESLYKFKEYLKNKQKVKEINENEDYILLRINELYEMINNIDEENREYYYEWIKTLEEEYRVDINKLKLNRNYSDVEYKLHYERIVKNYTETINIIENAIEEYINNKEIGYSI